MAATLLGIVFANGKSHYLEKRHLVPSLIMAKNVTMHNEWERVVLFHSYRHCSRIIDGFTMAKKSLDVMAYSKMGLNTCFQTRIVWPTSVLVFLLNQNQGSYFCQVSPFMTGARDVYLLLAMQDTQRHEQKCRHFRCWVSGVCETCGHAVPTTRPADVKAQLFCQRGWWEKKQREIALIEAYSMKLLDCRIFIETST